MHLLLFCIAGSDGQNAGTVCNDGGCRCSIPKNLIRTAIFCSQFVLEIHRNRNSSQYRRMLWHLDHDAGVKHVLCGLLSEVDADFADMSCDRTCFRSYCNSAAQIVAKK